MKTNITLSADEQVLDRARDAARTMGKSLNQVIRDYLEELAGLQSPHGDVAEVIELSRTSGGHRQGWRFDRDQLHERT